MKCLVAGQTGLVGGKLVELLLNDSRITRVVSVLRRRLKSPAVSKYAQIVSEFDHLDGIDVPAIDIAFCCLGTTIKKAGSEEAFRLVDHDYVLRFARLAKRAGARRFVLVSALGADPESKVFYNKVKGEVERDLATIGFSSLILVRPSLLLGERSESRPGEKMAIRLFPFYKYFLMGPLRAYTPITAETVAKNLVQQVFVKDTGTKVLNNEEMLKLNPTS
jgi:uncharacterized protein YbjT (DUF2867 family)